MLRITIPGVELWDEGKEEFSYTSPQTITLEHSLVALAKWEAKWHKPYLNGEKKTQDEVIDYVRCMSMTQNVDPTVYNYLTEENILAITRYIETPATATRLPKDEAKKGRTIGEVTTSERIYSWMILLGIPFECQKWHLSRLLTLIQLLNQMNQKTKPKKKISQRELNDRYAKLNAERRKRLNTKG